MKVKVITLDGASKSDLDLSDDIFSAEIRKDILSRVVEWQRAKKQSGLHSSKAIHDIRGTTKKPFKQKGTGNARQGSLRGPHMRKGAAVHGPRVRSHAYDLPKKIRKLGLKSALSVKASEGKLTIVESLDLKNGKAKELAVTLEKQGWKSVLFIDGMVVSENFKKASGNIHGVDVLPQIGANVYDILRHDALVLTVDAVKHLQERLA